MFPVSYIRFGVKPFLALSDVQYSVLYLKKFQMLAVSDVQYGVLHFN